MDSFWEDPHHGNDPGRSENEGDTFTVNTAATVATNDLSSMSAPITNEKERRTDDTVAVKGEGEDGCRVVPDNMPRDNEGGDDSDSDSDIEIIAVTHSAAPLNQKEHKPHENNTNIQQQSQQQGNVQESSSSSGTNQTSHTQAHHNHMQQSQRQNISHQSQSTGMGIARYGNYNISLGHIYHFPTKGDHIPTWENVLAKQVGPAPMRRTTNEVRMYRLSLLSSKEFTVTAIMHHTNSPYFEPTLDGMRRPIKEITRNHGNGDKAVLDEGRWRIPLSVYYAFYSFLSREPNVEIEPISDNQLKIASMGRAAAVRGYPSPEELMESGVPRGIAKRLAPYQRGGVDFLIQRNGRALIADEMGLGKTIQGIASMTCWEDEWPLLVLTPSSARYHWEAEFLQWLGADSSYNKVDSDDDEIDDTYLLSSAKRKRWNDDGGRKRKKEPKSMKLLKPEEIKVLGSSNEAMFDIYKDGTTKTRVVIISYGLIPNLVRSGKLKAGKFKCCIVDESHMLKNKKSKRTQSIMPLLTNAKRVVMLSGTPAFSKPAELFPQLNALGSKNGWWEDENEFNTKYVKDRYSDPSFAELHALLTSTVMIRRMKNDILKDLPKKDRESVRINIRCTQMSNDITDGLLALRSGKGVLGQLSLLHQKNLKGRSVEVSQERDVEDRGVAPAQNTSFGTFGENRKAILNKIFRLTGMAKIPIIVDMLKHWIRNPTNSKLCIFAHHVGVLDGIMNGAGLSNEHNSNSKYIRIDGSTQPKARQQQITSFQNDPSIRIAILGITAAGVGVTLTACSQIWFAELFWTPAIMIQAEDRCHRIGQQAKVRCLYTIARNTLDEVLWILLKRKFQSLGEFVEGKEMMTMVVHKEYDDEIAAVDRGLGSIGFSDSENGLENRERNGGSDLNELANEDDIQHDFEELAMEEQKNYGVGEEEDVVDDDIQCSSTAKTCSNEKPQNNVICLSDDEDQESPSKLPEEDLLLGVVLRKCQENRCLPTINWKVKLPELTFFQVFFAGDRYNIKFNTAYERVFVDHGSGHGPMKGDILIAINSWVIPIKSSFYRVIQTLKENLGAQPVRLVFGRDKDLSVLYHEYTKWRLQQEREKTTVKASQAQAQALTSEVAGGISTSTVHPQNGVIELLDD